MDERSGVVDVSIRYAQAVDERDWELLAGVFTRDVEVSYSSGNHVEGRDAVVAQVRAALEGCGPTQHLIGNHVVELDGDRARSSCYVRPSLRERPMAPGQDTPMICSRSIATSW